MLLKKRSTTLITIALTIALVMPLFCLRVKAIASGDYEITESYEYFSNSSGNAGQISKITINVSFNGYYSGTFNIRILAGSNTALSSAHLMTDKAYYTTIASESSYLVLKAAIYDQNSVQFEITPNQTLQSPNLPAIIDATTFSSSNLTAVDHTAANYSSQLSTIINSLASIANNTANTYYTQISNLQTEINDQGLTLDSILTQVQNLPNINANLANIDNMIDTISWSSDTSVTIPFSTDLSTWSTTSTDSISNPIYLDISSVLDSNESLFYIYTPLNYSNNFPLYSNFDIECYYVPNSGSVRSIPIDYYIQNQNRRLALYLHTQGNFTPSSAGSFKVVLKLNGSSTMYYRSASTFYKTLPSNDIEYWQLLAFIQQNKSNLTIIDYLRQLLSGSNASQAAESANDQQNNALDNAVQQQHQVESTFNSNFENDMADLDPTDITDELTQFANAFQWFTIQVTKLYEAHGSFRILYTLPLMLGIALFFIGRGNLVYRSGRNSAEYAPSDHADTTPNNSSTSNQRYTKNGWQVDYEYHDPKTMTDEDYANLRAVIFGDKK